MITAMTSPTPAETSAASELALFQAPRSETRSPSVARLRDRVVISNTSVGVIESEHDTTPTIADGPHVAVGADAASFFVAVVDVVAART
jgi:hypothetical protein